MSSQETKKSATEAPMDDPGRMLTAKFLNKANSKKDLVLRLRRILKCLREDETIEPDSDEYPGLAALCHALTRTVNHKDKEVRLYTVAACMELFTIYAPEAPWNQVETLDIFQQTIRQLANLGHSLHRSNKDSNHNAHFYQYYRILELLAEVKIAVLLVDLSKKNDDEEEQHHDESSSSSSSSDASKYSKSGQISRATTAAKTQSINKEALQVLAELFRTLLSSVRNEHPAELLEYCQKTLTACVEEFFESTILPIPILDELLVCIGQGPNVLVLQQQQQQQDKSKKRKAAQQPPALVYVQQKNPSYMVASAVLRASVDRLSTPIATLLNGLVNSDPRSIGASKISNHDFCTTNETGSNNNHDSDAISPHILELAQSLGKATVQQQEHSVNVYSVILELQRVAPAILTTIIGTLANHVETPDVSQRLLVVQTLGKLFAGGTSLSSGSGNNDKADSNNHSKTTTTSLTLAYQYGPCFRRWLQRSADKRLEIRKIMLPHLLALTKQQGNTTELVSSQAVELAKDVQEALVQRLTQEPHSKFRTEVVQGLCTLSYQYRKILTPRVMQELGDRVLSKDKAERKDALTGLVQLYFKQFLRHALGAVLDGGDDCPIETVLEVLSVSAAAAAPVSQIVSSPKNSRKRQHRKSKDTTDESTDDVSYYQWIPGVLFESASYSDAIDSEMHSRVVQLIDELLLGSSSPHPDNRRKLTSTGRATGLILVINAIRDNPKAMHWMGKLMTMRSKLQTTLQQYLEARSDIRNHKTGSEEYFAADASAKDLLEVIASMIPPPSGSSPAPGERHAVLEKFHSIKDKHVFRILGTITNPAHSAKARARALDDLPKRVKAITKGDALSTWVKSLAKRCAMGDFINLDTIHHCVLLAQECYHEGEIDAAHKFLVCVKLAVDSFPSLCASGDVFDNLTELFRDCNTSSSRRSSAGTKDIGEVSILTVLSSILASVAPYRDSDSPEVEEDLHKKLLKLCQNGTPEQAKHAVATIVSLLKTSKEEEASENAFVPLLQSLATPSRLAIATTGSSKNLLCVLAALTELADHSPGAFVSSSRGTKALKFALEMVLMGRAHVAAKDSDDEGDGDDSEEDTKTPQRGRNRKKSTESTGHLSPSAAGTNPVEDENLSVSCRTLCAAMEFLSTFIRSSVFTAKKTRSTLPPSTQDLIGQVFNVYSQILRDQGMPPSSRDRKLCGLRQDRAALRQCAAIQLFRLCDTRLGLDQKNLTTQRWHLLASSLLDDEPVVRKAVMEELGLMLTGNGKFGVTLGMGAMAPRLRFVAMSVFCIDGSQGSHSRANGNAANIGKAIQYQKGNIAGCIAFLRKVYESSAAQCRAQGPDAEHQFETFTKLTVMPEYSVPYAFHLLVYRHETPSMTKSGKDDEHLEFDESGQRVLRKRLKALYDPLVLQLGASADNISFLLRMAEMLAKSFQPIDCNPAASGNNSTGRAQDKLTNICATAREVLLSYVKTDANLDTHPGAIRMPGNLYCKRENRKRSVEAISSTSDTSPILDMMIHAEDVAPETRETNQKRPGEVLPGAVEQVGYTQTASNDEDETKSRPRRSTRSSRSREDSSSRTSVSTDTKSRNEDASNESIQRENSTRRGLRRSSRSTRSTKFESPEDAEMSDSVDIHHEDESTDKGSRPIGSSQSTKDVMQSPNMTETPLSTRHSIGSNKKRRSEISQVSQLTTSQVHFSPEVDFGGLSPIGRRSSRNSANRKALLSSSESKTRGSTPPSSLRNAKFTATASAFRSSAGSPNASAAESPTPVSESTTNHSDYEKPKPLGDKQMEKAQSRRKHETRNLAVGDKENTTKKNKQVPKQIKIVRSKGSPKLKVSKPIKKTRSSAGKRGKVKKSTSKPIDSFDFE